jgi:hypothetical protein
MLHTHLSLGGWYSRPISGRHTKWSQSHSTARGKNWTTLTLRKRGYTSAEFRGEKCGSYRKANPSSRRREGPISRHINGLWMNKFWSWVPKPRMTVLARTCRNVLCYAIIRTALHCTALRTVVSSQSQCSETRELKGLIKEPFSINGCIHDASLTTLFQPSGIMSHVTSHMTVFSGSIWEGHGFLLCSQ